MICRDGIIRILCIAAAGIAVALRPGLVFAQAATEPPSFELRGLNDKPVRDYQGLPFEDWMLYPSLFIGAVYDDNIFQSTTDRVSQTGLKLRPSLRAERDTGLHQTSVFVNGDFNIYANEASADTTNAQVALTHRWEAMRDLVFTAGVEYDRRTDIYNNGVVTGLYGNSGLIATPQRYNYFGGYVSGLKSFNRFFVGLTASAYGTTYDPLYTTDGAGAADQSYRNNLVTSVTGRVGYNVTPVLYAYVEGGGNFHNFSSDTAYSIVAPGVPSSGTIYNSEGYRVTGGLGTDRLGLFRGEIYAGYQQQLYEDSALFGSPSSPVYGGKVYYYPTRDWSLLASLDETYQDSGLTTYGNTTGSAARVTTAALSANYALARQWSASVNGGYSDVSYITGGRHDERWSAGTTVNYEIARNIAATFSYSLVLVESNAIGGSFTRNQFSLGATYKY